jgi:hypothetical protein
MTAKVLQFKKDEKGKYIVAGAALGSAVLAATQPASAATDTGTLDDVTAMVTSLGGIAAVVTGVVLGAMGVRMAIKLVNRISVKG